MDLNNLYTEVILEHNKETKNRREIEGYTHKERGHNPSCGDDITVEAKIENGVIIDLAYNGHGCSISQASASMMTDLLTGKTVEEAMELIRIFLGMIKREIQDMDYLEDVGYLKQNKKLRKLIIKEKRIIIINHLLISHILHQN